MATSPGLLTNDATWVLLAAARKISSNRSSNMGLTQDKTPTYTLNWGNRLAISIGSLLRLIAPAAAVPTLQKHVLSSLAFRRNQHNKSKSPFKRIDLDPSNRQI